jgi:two-component system, cell cycle sensor histidine kinase and response regulator CckA
MLPVGSGSPADALLALASSMDDLVFCWRQTGEMLWTNPSFERVTGMTAADFAYRTAQNPFIHPEDLSRVLAHIESFRLSQEPVSEPVENRFFDIWGKVIRVRTRVHRIAWQGEPVFLSLTQVLPDAADAPPDTTHRRLVEAADDGILQLEAGGGILYSNRRMHELCVRRHVDLARRPFTELFDATDQAIARSALKDVVRSGQAATFSGRLDGSNRWLHVKLTRLEAPAAPVVVLAIARDISEARRLAQQLAESEERLRLLTDNLPDGYVYQLRIDRDGQRCFTHVSGGVERLHGLTQAEIYADASTLYSRLAPDDRTRVFAAEDDSAATGRPFAVEVEASSPRGERQLLLRSIPRSTGDGGTTWDGVALDVTDRRRAEEERVRLEDRLQQAERMESIGRLAGGIAHDFNNILTAVVANVAIAAEELAADHPVQGMLRDIGTAAQSGEALTRQLLAFSRRQVVNPRPVAVNPVLTRLEKLLRRLIGEHVRMSLVLDDEVGPLLIDLGQLEQIVVNLAVNARDAMEHGGELCLRTARVQLDVSRSAALQLPVGEYVGLTVSDTGVGIPDDLRPRIFEPFFTTKENGGGTGLGLATVYGVVKQNGGAIEVHSRPGEGTTFEVYLPRCPEDVGAATASDDATAKRVTARS